MFRQRPPIMYQPTVTLLDTANSVTDGASFTFSAMNLGGMSGTAPLNSLETTVANDNPLLAVPGRKVILCIVHLEDSATNFGVTSVTIGGVAGTEELDRGGGTTAINTAMYLWRSEQLAAIANTDVIVTPTETCTACAVGVLEIDNVRSSRSTAEGIAQTAGDINISTGINTDVGIIGGVVIMGISCVTGGGTETPSFINRTASTPPLDAFEPDTLYFGNNAELDFAAAVFQSPTVFFYSGLAARQGVGANWSGAGGGDGNAIYIV